MKILFVCLGNICRSPLAEAIFTHKIKEKGLESQFSADSCGMANYHIGHSPDTRTIRNVIKNGVQMRHLGRQFSSVDFDAFDVILPMDKSNLNNILQLSNDASHLKKVKLVREYDPNGQGEVPDPYYGTDKDFQEVFDILDRTIENLIDELKT